MPGKIRGSFVHQLPVALCVTGNFLTLVQIFEKLQELEKMDHTFSNRSVNEDYIKHYNVQRFVDRKIRRSNVD